jgi:uncharacterized cupredoxin-like copper-binding protein
MRKSNTKDHARGLLPVLLVMMFAVAAHAHAHERKEAFDPSKVEQKAFGKAGDPRKAVRTIKVAMDDNMRFTPDAISVAQGETVKFVASNRGGMLHEMVIGTMQELQEHAALMKKFPDMEHEEAHMLHVKPGSQGTIVWTFNKPGEFHFACLIAGHFEAGMVGRIRVAATGSRIR